MSIGVGSSCVGTRQHRLFTGDFCAPASWVSSSWYRFLAISRYPQVTSVLLLVWDLSKLPNVLLCSPLDKLDWLKRINQVWVSWFIPHPFLPLPPPNLYLSVPHLSNKHMRHFLFIHLQHTVPLHSPYPGCAWRVHSIVTVKVTTQTEELADTCDKLMLNCRHAYSAKG